MKSTANAKAVEALAPMFATFSFRFSLRTEFVSEEFEAFFHSNGIEHQRTMPLWPQANGEAEK